jgi:serine/threonine protein kinase
LTSKRNYGCFFCGQPSSAPVVISDPCKCGQPYDRVILRPPAVIGDYQIERSLSRGFYGATYVVKKGSLGLKWVLKIIPTTFYSNRNITIEEEVRNHVAAADGAEFIVAITDNNSQHDVDFGGHIIACHCIEMEYIEGFVLSELCNGTRSLSAESAVQISCDLISVLGELQQRELNHNDLHDGNIVIKELKPSAFRAAAIDKKIKAMAIDLGSVDSQRREGADYLSDVQWIAKHLLTFSDILAMNNPQKSDLRARVAFALRQRALELTAPQANQTTPPLEDIVESIRNAYQNAKKKYDRGWSRALSLSSFSTHRNAQTLESWHVPKLMVDPSEQWLSELHTGGPVVVTGMRGCGKTMLLRSLELHARISKATDSSASGGMREQLIGDGYIGVFASARHVEQKLLETDDDLSDPQVVSSFFVRLFIVYAMKICDALTHLEEVCPGSVADGAAEKIAAVVFGQVDKANPLQRGSSLDDLHQHLIIDAELWSTASLATRLVAEPWSAFVLLAKTVQGSLQNFGSPQILFLLDDVSTRYLKPTQIELVVSTLLVQDPVCAFKITSETQTFFLSIKSPAQINLASDERDYESFDLGSKVLDKLKDLRKGSDFLMQILSRRMGVIGGDLAKHSPKEIMGDVPLVEIARDICSVSKGNAKEKPVYHGFSSLRGVCIGDLGSMIALYEEIYEQAVFGQLPVSVAKQHEVFQRFCSNQLFQLNNRDEKQKTEISFKKIALDFAQASHDELIDSYRNENDRLRQICSLNVTLEEGNKEQVHKLLELVDAGVFALHPQKISTRAKNLHADPVLQFKLSFRKILGISKLMGLSDRDRFELNGEELLRWLSGQSGKEILSARTRRYDGIEDAKATALEEHTSEEEPAPTDIAPKQLDLKLAAKPTFASDVVVNTPVVAKISPEAIKDLDTLVVSLGFEDRCMASARLLALAARPKRIVAIEYDIPGYMAETQALADEVGAILEVYKRDEVLSATAPKMSGSALFDVSGLTKPVIYKLVKEHFQSTRHTYAAISEPEEYHPTEADLAQAIGDGKDFWGESGVTRLAGILSGDELPYSLSVVDELRSDPSRNTELCAFSSAKHARLIHLIEETTYDDIVVMLQSGDTSRHAVARKAASIATGGGELGAINEYREDDATEILNLIFANHFKSYVQRSSNFEIALTGGKLETIACAIAGACLPINKVLYVKPAAFDPSNFSKGIGATNLYEIYDQINS